MQDGNPDVKEGGLINFAKRTALAKVSAFTTPLSLIFMFIIIIL